MILISATAALCAPVVQAQQGPGDSVQLASSTALSSEGYFVITWDMGTDSEANAGQALLQRSLDPDFSSPHNTRIDSRGSVTVTGLEDGIYYFRAGYEGAGAGAGNWSESLRVTVRHHDLGRAGFFFFIGLCLFIVLTSTIVIGNRHRETAGD